MKQYSLIQTTESFSNNIERLDKSYPPQINKLKPTKAYNLYWYFASERQKVFYNRYMKKMAPWTTDPIISKHKFTNPYRATDRTSQFLIKEVIYNENRAAEDTLFRIILFKIFNKIETWKLLDKQCSNISLQTFDTDLYDKILTNAMYNGNKIYSAAYIMPSGGRNSEFKKKHRMHLNLINRMIHDKIYLSITKSKSLKQVYDLLIKYPSIGSFLAFQYAIDINYSNICNHNENEFIVAGPGAVSGITKCFRDLGSYNYSDVIKLMCDIQDDEFSRLHLQFKGLNNRKLHLIDCQNLFCETDKYARIACPDIVGISNRTRIKQVFKPNPSLYELFFPPKWRINQHTPFEHNDD